MLDWINARVLGSKHPDPAIRNADVVAEKLLGPAERAILKDTGSTIVLDALAMVVKSPLQHRVVKRGGKIPGALLIESA